MEKHNLSDKKQSYLVLVAGCHLKEHRGRKHPPQLWKSTSPGTRSWIKTSFMFQMNNSWVFFSGIVKIQYPASEECLNCCSLQKVAGISLRLTRPIEWAFIYAKLQERGLPKIWSRAQIVKSSNKTWLWQNVFWIHYHIWGILEQHYFWVPFQICLQTNSQSQKLHKNIKSNVYRNLVASTFGFKYRKQLQPRWTKGVLVVF